jgi:hypothetical protein
VNSCCNSLLVNWVLRGALSRLEPSAVKVACSVLRGGVDRKVCPLPDRLTAEGSISFPQQLDYQFARHWWDSPAIRPNPTEHRVLPITGAMRLPSISRLNFVWYCRTAHDFRVFTVIPQTELVESRLEKIEDFSGLVRMVVRFAA